MSRCSASQSLRSVTSSDCLTLQSSAARLIRGSSITSTAHTTPTRPGQLINNVNEPKFEGQLNYTRPINKRFAWTVGILYHHNFKFPDDYWWGLGGIVYTEQLGKKVTLTAAGLVEKKLGHGRAFVDGSATLEYRFIENWNTQISVHRYENQGQFDASPTQKLELEFGAGRLLKHKQFVGVSFFVTSNTALQTTSSPSSNSNTELAFKRTIWHYSRN